MKATYALLRRSCLTAALALLAASALVTPAADAMAHPEEHGHSACNGTYVIRSLADDRITVKGVLHATGMMDKGGESAAFVIVTVDDAFELDLTGDTGLSSTAMSADGKCVVIKGIYRETTGAETGTHRTIAVSEIK